MKKVVNRAVTINRVMNCMVDNYKSPFNMVFGIYSKCSSLEVGEHLGNTICTEVDVMDDIYEGEYYVDIHEHISDMLDLNKDLCCSRFQALVTGHSPEYLDDEKVLLKDAKVIMLI